EGVVFSTFFTTEIPITETSKIFIDEYRKEYKKEPAAVTALGFDAYLVILDAIKKAGSTDTNAVRDAIAKTKGFPGAAGIITLDSNGDAVKNAVIKTVRDGNFSFVTTIVPE
ncbi:MAG: ABC transporter substrate-binding protein, partial [Alkalispirochaeta sp.]